MRFWPTAAAVSLAALVAGCGGQQTETEPGDWRSEVKELRMAVSGSDTDPAMISRRDLYRKSISEATGLPVKMFESSDYNGAIQAISSGQVDMAQFGAASYANVDAQVGELVAPILAVREAEGGTGYYSTIVVRADSPYRTVNDLKGRSIGYVDFNSTSGYLIPRTKLRQQGIDADTFFGKSSFSGGHTQAVMALANGQFDAAILSASGGDPQHGFTRGPLHTMARRGLVDLDDFRIIWTGGPIPTSPFVMRTDRPQPMIDIVRGALAALPYDEPDLWPQTGQIQGSNFTAVDRSDYKDIIDIRTSDLAERRGRGGRP